VLTLAACSSENGDTESTTSAAAEGTDLSCDDTITDCDSSTVGTTTTTGSTSTIVVGGIPTDREEYVDAAMIDAPASTADFDTRCLAEGVVDAIGIDTLLELDVAPVELFEADDFLDLGVENTPGLRSGLEATLRRCTNLEGLASQVIGGLGQSFPRGEQGVHRRGNGGSSRRAAGGDVDRR